MSEIEVAILYVPQSRDFSLNPLNHPLAMGLPCDVNNPQ